MRALILYPLTFVLFVGGIVAFPLIWLLRPLHRRWGATTGEIKSPMLGDAEVPGATYQATRATTIRAAPGVVWPWIAQMGYRRAGWYGYDQFDNDGVPSATCILPEYQHPLVGDVIGEEGLTLRVIQPNMSLVASFAHPQTVWVFKEGIWPKFGSSSLEYALHPIGEDQTRLVIRIRFRLRLLALPTLWWPFFEVGDFLNARKQLAGIKRRVEAGEHKRGE